MAVYFFIIRFFSSALISQRRVLVYYNKPGKGGHFAAWEQPESFTLEMRASFKSFRQ
jgi:hypothetical protein